MLGELRKRGRENDMQSNTNLHCFVHLPPPRSLASVMIRRLKKDMLKNLPPKRRRHININLEDESLARKIGSNMVRLREVSTGKMNEIATALESKRLERMADKGIKEIPYTEAMEKMGSYLFQQGMMGNVDKEELEKQKIIWEKEIKENR